MVQWSQKANEYLLRTANLTVKFDYIFLKAIYKKKIHIGLIKRKIYHDHPGKIVAQKGAKLKTEIS